MNFMQAYIAGFQRCYPEKHVEIKPKKVRGEIRYAVSINHDRGDITLSEADVRDATRGFNRGK